MGEGEVVCPVCDSTNYELKDGLYYCVLCQTQSQELGHETMMDDNMLLGLDMCGGPRVTISKKQKGSGKGVMKADGARLAKGVRWSTAEGCTWVLQGWVRQLADLGVEVQVAVTQLWTLYLKELRMGFEEKEFAPDRCNMNYRERWNSMGGPPVLLEEKRLKSEEKKRKRAERRQEEEEEDAGLAESFSAKKIRRKKRRQFFASQTSEADTSASESEAPSEAGFSDDGYLTDASDLSILGERTKPKPIGPTPETACPIPVTEFLPCKLTVTNLAAVLALAVVTSPGSTTTLSDLCRLWNSDQLNWQKLFKFLPKKYRMTSRDLGFFSYSPRRMVWSEAWLGRLAHRIASFLLRGRPAGLPAVIAVSSRQASLPSPLSSLLVRTLEELCLPSSLGPDITAVFQGLHLTDMAATVLEYEPDIIKEKMARKGALPTGPWNRITSRNWALQSLPSATTRVLALVVVYLKYLWGLDDQTEYIHQHNLRLLAATSPSAAFCPVTWLRLSKLRLERLATLCPHLRHQYRNILPALATPSLSLASVAATLKARDLATWGRHAGAYGATTEDQFSTKASKDLALLARLVKAPVTEATSPAPSLRPLASATHLLLQSKEVPAKVKEKVAALQALASSSLSLASSGRLQEAARDLPRLQHTAARTWTSSQEKFADLRGRDTKEVQGWRRTQVVDDGKAELANKHRLVELSDEMPMTGAQKEMVLLEGKGEYLESLYRAQWNTERSCFTPPRPQAGVLMCLTKQQYWLHHPSDLHALRSEKRSTAPSATWKNLKKECLKVKDKRMYSQSRDPGASDRLLLSLPSNYSWLVRYMSSYGHLDPLALHLEVATVERLLLALDPQYFGTPKTITIRDPAADKKQERRNEMEEEERVAREKERREAAEQEVVRAAAKRRAEMKRYMELGEEERLWWSYRQVQGQRERAVKEQEEEFKRRLKKAHKRIGVGSAHKDRELGSEERVGQVDVAGEDPSEEAAKAGDEANEEGDEALEEGEEADKGRGDVVKNPELRPWEWRCERCEPCRTEDCGECPGCREASVCRGRAQCVGQGYTPRPPAAAIQCGRCRHCTREDCGDCWRCRDMPKFGGPGLNGKPCSRKRFCAKDCGVCPSCLTKPQFGGQDPGAKCPYRGAKWRLPGKAPKKAKVMACGVQGKAKKVSRHQLKAEPASLSSMPSRNTATLPDGSLAVTDAVWARLWATSWRVLATRDTGRVPRYVCQLCHYKVKTTIREFKVTKGDLKTTVNERGAGMKARTLNQRKLHVKHMALKHAVLGEYVLPDSEATSEEEQEDSLVCTVCAKVSTSVAHLKRHMKMHNREHKCPVCSVIFNTWLELTRHKATHFPEDKICPYCDKEFELKSFRNMHIRAVHKAVPPGVEAFQCTYCDAAFPKKVSLTLHTYQRHKESRKKKEELETGEEMEVDVTEEDISEENSNDELGEETNVTFDCTKCDKSYDRKTELTRHVNYYNHRETDVSLVSLDDSRSTRSRNKEVQEEDTVEGVIEDVLDGDMV